MLHGDYYHLLNKVWSDIDNFGDTVYKPIKRYMQHMLTSKKIENNGHNSTRARNINHPLQLELLDKIFNNPEQYSRHYIRTISCNRKRKGGVPTEKSHTLNAHLGDGVTWYTMKKVQSSLQHQKQYHFAHINLEINQ